MSGLKKKKTSELKRYESTLIKGIQVPEGYTDPVILFSKTTGGGATEQLLPISADAWARAARGAGTPSRHLGHGLVGTHRFVFTILVEPADVDNINITSKAICGTKPGEMVVGIHCVPESNYLGATYSDDIGHPIPDGAVVVNVHDKTGELDVVAFPLDFRRSLRDFVRQLETMEEIDSSTSVIAGGVQFSVTSIYGSEVTFRASKING